MNQASIRSTSPVPPSPIVASSVLAGLVLAVAASSAIAQDAPRNLLGAGAISIPEFEGAGDQTVRPFLVGRLDLGRYGSLRLSGLTVHYNLLDAQNRWAVGPVVSLRPARDRNVTDPVVRNLREVGSTAEAGLFVEYGFFDMLARGDRLSLGVEAKGGNGSQLTWIASYQSARSGAFQYGVDLRATYANDKHMETYFSVDADNSQRSGLPTYVASGGLKSTAIGFTGSYDLSRHWTLVGRLGVSRLAGDAKDSPIVRLRGDPNSVFAGLAVGYRF